MATFTDRLMVLGDGTAGTAGMPQLLANDDILGITGNVDIGGNLTVVGTIISGGALDMVVTDHYLDLNHGQITTTVNGGGGLTVNVTATTGVTALTATAFTKAVSNGANGIITTSATAATHYAVGDIIQVSGADDPENNGLFAVATINGATGFTIYGIGAANPLPAGVPFCQNDLTTSAGNTATVVQVDLGCIAIADGVQQKSSTATFAKGTWCTAYHAAATTTLFATGWDTLASGVDTLAAVTAAGHSTTTNCDFTGGIDFATVAPTSSAGFTFTGTTPSSSVGWNVTGGTSLFTAGQLKFNDTIEAHWGSGGDLQIFHTSVGAGSFIENQTTGGPLTIENKSLTGDIICKLGMSTTATSFEVQSAAGTKLMEIAGSGQVDFAGNVDANLGLDVSGGALVFTGTAGSWTFAQATSTLTQTGAGLVTITGATTHGGAVHIADNTELQLGGTVNGEDFNVSFVTASNATEFDNTNVLGSTSFLLGTDTDVTEFNIKNNSATTLFKVDAAGETTLTGALTSTALEADTTIKVQANANDATLTLLAESDDATSWGLGKRGVLDLHAAVGSLGFATYSGQAKTDVISWEATADYSQAFLNSRLELQGVRGPAFTRWEGTPGNVSTTLQMGMVIGFENNAGATKIHELSATDHNLSVIGFSTWDYDDSDGCGYSDMVGEAGMQMQVAPVAADIGKIVYLDATNAGKVTLTPPSASGDTVYRIGTLWSHTGQGGQGKDENRTLYMIHFQPQFIIEIP